MTHTPKVYAAIAAVMAEIGTEGISKDRKNAQQGYQFRGIDDVYNALNPILAKNRLVILPRVTSHSQQERQTKSGGNLFYTTVTAEFILACAEDGSTVTISTCGEAMDSADKSTNKAMAAAYKYAAMMAFCIPTEGDHDADGTTHELAPAAPPPNPEMVKKITDSLPHTNTVIGLENQWKSASADLQKLNDVDYATVKAAFAKRKAELTQATQEAA